jgi:hypothetical protein
LKDHPIDWQKDEISEWHEDVEFLVGEMKRRKDQLEKVCATLAEQNAALEGRWIGKEPMLRLIHCLIEDDGIKSAFIRRHNSKDRMQLENRNSAEKRDPTVWELISAKWNDRDFNPKTMILHIEGQTEFSDEIDLEYSSVQHFAAATPDKCETKFNEMMVALKRIIQGWEASGQGEGGVNNEDEEDDGFEINVRHELGSLKNRSTSALASRPNFFRFSEMYLLYLWEVCEIFDLTRSCMQTLEDSVAAGDGGEGVPLLFDHPTNVDLTQGSDDESYMGSLKGPKSGSKASNSEAKAISSIAKDLKQLHERSIALQKFEEEQKEKDRSHATKERLSHDIETLEQEKRQYEWQMLVHNSKRQRLDVEDPTADAMQMFINNIGERLENKKRELDEFDEKMKSLNETPQKSNRTP